ncbi:hypothetical protein C8R47DRAFT_983777 [Mycena vitilis]|nr:hypothetical protein C8R47DRAFT_983777 [Mycena vitilis]
MVAVLPPELEREILEFAGISFPEFIPTLMLVSREARRWMESLLYHVLIFTAPQASALLAAIHNKSPSFLSSAVRKLLLGECRSDLSDILHILSCCSGTTDLFFMAPTGQKLLPLISAMPLQRLAADLRSLFRGLPVDFHHPLFANITHLCVFPSPRDDLTEWVKVRHIPHLTHLAFHTSRDPPMLLEVLRVCPHLRVLVDFYFFRIAVTGPRLTVDHELWADLRYVRMRCGIYADDWMLGAYTGRDHWTRAEEWVEKRRLGVVERLQYVVPDGTI